ncbi:hypothetical protein BGX29_010211 [Mortierella sp. GBA35]|nr:hypothetical protein BGX23_001190 [Mortierella sp. AD031]KAF9108604.1 hypothetical protein BGX29_010211 [Mortierella sp. GBA35]KAG0213043.1 hypothetical protein BGX33_003175 [Mortierella sp. NVP41]
MAIDFQFQALANSDNTLVAGKVIAVASLGLFAGSSLSFSAVIMPSLRKFSSASSLAIWTESHNHSKFLELSLIAASVAGSAGLYYKTKNVSYLYGAATAAAVIPYTLIALLPINKKLLAIRQNNTIGGKADSMKDNKSNDSDVEALLSRWSLFHFGRTILGLGALFVTLYGVVSEDGVRFILFNN